MMYDLKTYKYFKTTFMLGIGVVWLSYFQIFWFMKTLTYILMDNYYPCFIVIKLKNQNLFLKEIKFFKVILKIEL